MKSFKLISVQIVTPQLELIDVQLVDGLIINKEDDARTWLLEAFVQEGHYKQLENNLPKLNEEVNIQAVITKKDNDPAFFHTVLRTLRFIDGHVSLLFVGHLQSARNRYAEILLEDLVRKGIEGQQLVEEFKEKIHSKHKVAAKNVK
ncbi:YwpF family protein [Bacillus massiliglaciei]|uniref:YwpF family protein n=1 Tax=Bacillus massiliglaciei TaxID=1816693 RepID=UPI000DA6089D|nr:YwpF family protein [Bacillus massiliglaciei]